MKLMKLLAEKSNNTDAIEVATVNKMKADAKKLGAKQRQISQLSKNTSDTYSKARYSQQSADIAGKKADLGLTIAQKNKQMKDKTKIAEERIKVKALMPVKETTQYNANPEYVDTLVMIGKNMSDAYKTRNAIGAIEVAIKELRKEKYAQIESELKLAKKEAIKQLSKYWKQEER